MNAPMVSRTPSKTASPPPVSFPLNREGNAASIREAYLKGREHLRAAAVEYTEVEAEVLLRYALAAASSPPPAHRGLIPPWPRASLYARWEEPIPDQGWRAYVDLLEERSRGRPLAYIIGRREFMGLDFLVDERVLIPRPETEVLVEALLKEMQPLPRPLVVDVGTGSGAIAIALAVYHRGAEIVATDISEAALEVAEENARRHNILSRISFLRGDLLHPLDLLDTSPLRIQARRVHRRVDAIVSNPPYVPSEHIPELPPSIREYEPLVALDGGEDGLHSLRRIIQQSLGFLRPGGVLALEVMAGQGPVVAGLMEKAAYEKVRTVADFSGVPRVVVATTPRL